MIDADTLASIVAHIEAQGVSDAGLQSLRNTWPKLHFTVCTEDDVPARLAPAATGAGFAVYLVSGLTHCIQFTTQLEAATGLVIAILSDA